MSQYSPTFQVLCRLREWRNEIKQNGEIAAEAYVNEVRRMIRTDLESVGGYGSQLEEQVTFTVGKEISYLLGNVNDKLRPFWWRQWSENRADRHVSTTTSFYITMSSYSLDCYGRQGFFESYPKLRHSIFL